MREDREGREMSAPNDAEEAGRLSRMKDQTRDGLGRVREGLAAGASGVMDLTRSVAGQTQEKAGRAVRFVRDAEADETLKASVSGTTERSLDRAGDALIGAAPAIGRGTEMAAEKVGQALRAVSHPLAVVLGVIAGTLGGWWKQAREESFDLPAPEDQACRAHFATVAVLPDMTYERARTGYALGWVASRNPEYLGLRFEDVEAELRRGFGDEHAADYESLREFTRYGYGRGSGVQP